MLAGSGVHAMHRNVLRDGAGVEMLIDQCCRDAERCSWMCVTHRKTLASSSAARTSSREGRAGGEGRRRTGEGWGEGTGLGDSLKGEDFKGDGLGLA